MGSRHALQEQNRAVGGMKQKNMAVAQVAGQNKSRRALGDIGNLVTLRPLDGKQIPSRPVTRSFCAQLLANAQKEAAENKKKPLTLNVAENKKVVPQPKKKATVKPKQEAIPQNVAAEVLDLDSEL